MVNKDLEKMYPKKERINSNLEEREREALESLRQNSSSVIKPSNKGGGVLLYRTQRTIVIWCCAS